MGLTSPKHFQLPPPQLSKEQLSLSTARLYQETNPANARDLNDPANHHGPFKKERSLLDFTYHLLPNRSRQELQDTLLEDYLKHSDNSCKTCAPQVFQKPLALFTAGGMGAVSSADRERQRTTLLIGACRARAMFSETLLSGGK